jgi:plastocyanin
MDVDGRSSPLEAHGCTFATATDRTGEANVTITDISAWVVVHNACIIVDAGTTVTWEGNFDSHPLRGGVSPSPDAANPIEMAGPGSGATPVSVMLNMAGDYPYYCGLHFSSMAGVIYVR